jgi:hypothetical protein
MIQGDDGGALVILRNNALTQIGVHSFVSTAGCGAGLPAGYVRITSILPWIRGQVGPGY